MILTDLEKEYLRPNIFYFAKIEDNQDPNKMGRYKIRIYGIDSFNEEDIKIEHLPWAKTINNFGLSKTIGLSRQYKINDIVVCVLLNNNRDTPLILGCIEAPEDYGDYDFKNVTIRNDESIILEVKPPINEDEEEESKQLVTTKQTIDEISNKIVEDEDKYSEIIQTSKDLNINFKGDSETTITFKGDGKIAVKNDTTELISLLVEILDAIIEEKHIGNMGALTQLDPNSIQKYNDLKEKLSSFKV